MNAILLETDEIIVKPFQPNEIADIVYEKLLTRKVAVHAPKERVAAILQRCTSGIVEDWLARVKRNKTPSHIALSDKERTGYLPKLIEDLIVRLREPDNDGSEPVSSSAATAHGKMRRLQGYTPGMLVHDSRLLQVTLFGTLQGNLRARDFSLLLPDVMAIADEVDSQLTQAMDSHMSGELKPAAA